MANTNANANAIRGVCSVASECYLAKPCMSKVIHNLIDPHPSTSGFLIPCTCSGRFVAIAHLAGYLWDQ